MPNWCENRAVINAPQPVIDEIRQILDSERTELLQWMRPLPADQQDNWHDWCVSNWGTKWDLCDVYVINDAEDDSIEFSFSSAWSPPITAFQHWAEQDGRVSFTLKYYEPGMGFLGEANWSDDMFDEEYVEQQQDPARFEELARDEWGYEPEEEPEPLTEWYEQGVKDKGLV